MIIPLFLSAETIAVARFYYCPGITLLLASLFATIPAVDVRLLAAIVVTVSRIRALILFSWPKWQHEFAEPWPYALH